MTPENIRNLLQPLEELIGLVELLDDLNDPKAEVLGEAGADAREALDELMRRLAEATGRPVPPHWIYTVGLATAYLEYLRAVEARNADLRAGRPRPEVSVEALRAAAKGIIPERELELIDAGMNTACCCTNGADPVVTWCSNEWPNAHKEIR